MKCTFDNTLYDSLSFTRSFTTHFQNLRSLFIRQLAKKLLALTNYTKLHWHITWLAPANLQAWKVPELYIMVIVLLEVIHHHKILPTSVAKLEVLCCLLSQAMHMVPLISLTMAHKYPDIFQCFLHLPVLLFCQSPCFLLWKVLQEVTALLQV
ncbi:Os03g0448950 [Oryza sativa Japonica Group]|uniref:Os03g0448950 protein n=1 Tax=Oryza sativa subsp. japonica TaxID=39947 RepID=A0A0P0VZ91_ORYSJ|nr:hypothetical protein EE612_018359 [Oryza sativa]BAS84902.1 Os03g0448950 [Oryza sativa Japonica Group]